MNTIVNKISNVHNWLAGNLQIRDIPPRVVENIKAQQRGSERIIGWAQLTIVVIFAILYTLSPKAFTHNVTFAPVPWALAAYFVFTILRLRLSYKNKLTFGFLLISIVVDMALLFGLIWSFHIQYDQPASFYLKAPTLLYVFIFIALRTLRFEPGFVVFAGLVAATGWLFLSYYAIATTGMENITRDYVEYITSNMILIGAEWDKVVSIILVTAILTTGIVRGQKLLRQAIQSDAAAEELSRFVPDIIAQKIKKDAKTEDLGKTENGECTILFVDLRGFTTLSETMSPEQLIITLNAFFAEAATSVHNFGGVINQFQGDAILASFNIPKHNEAHASNAIRTAVEILNTLQSKTFADVKLNARVGINTGQVTGGLVGIPARLHYTIYGDEVNVAFRLEQLNKEFGTQVLFSENTKIAAGDDFEYELVTEQNLRGKSKATRIYTVSEISLSND